MSKITSSSADYQTFPTLFELEPVAGKKVTVDFTAPELSSLGGLTLVREYEKSSLITAFRHIRRLLTKNPCGSGKIKADWTATTRIKCGGYE